MARPVGGYYDEAGHKLLGSTSVLKYLSFIDSDALCGWAEKLAKQGLSWRKVRSEAGAHGSMLHDLCEDRLPHALDAEKDKPAKATPEAWERLQLSYAAIRTWFLLHEPKVVFHEEPLVSREFGFAGTPDGVAIFPRDIPEYDVVAGRHWLYDYKSGKMVGAKEVCQMASYRQLLKETRGIEVDGAILIHAPTAEPGYMRPVVLSSATLDLGWAGFRAGQTVAALAPQLAAATEA